MSHLSNEERHELGERWADRYERGRRATGEDVPPFGCPDALIYAHVHKALLELPDGADREVVAEGARDYAEGRLLAIVRRVCRQRQMGTDLYREIHDETLRIKAEIRAIEARQREECRS